MFNKPSPDIIAFLNKNSTNIFLNAAKNFITLLEIAEIKKEEFYQRSHKALIELYAAGHNLEQVELKYSGPNSNFDNEKLFENKNAGYISQLDKDAFYSEVFDPIEDKEAESPVQGWLVDDFYSIYRDLKIELVKIDKIGTDQAIEDALWQLKFGYYNHWGNHCINAMRALHYMWYEGKSSV
ncbi:MAG: DUF5063 domain-containing protein [Chitinophagaceae bacterium]|nr:DUF5063 domain-containing protein [Chitinophagaceae bacterium]